MSTAAAAITLPLDFFASLHISVSFFPHLRAAVDATRTP
jgi:hypothetical protein